jgi:hypothetical protein
MGKMKVVPGQSYVVNFDDSPVRIGHIYRMDENEPILALRFNDVFPGLSLAELTETGSQGDLKFTGKGGVDISFGVEGSAGDVGSAQVGFKFTKARTLVGALKDAAKSELAYGNIKTKLRQIWEEQGYDQYLDKYAFVFATVTAASGTLLFSLEKNNSVVLESKLKTPVKSLTALASGKFEYVTNTKRTFESIREVAHRPLFKAFTFNDKWEPQILGKK